jgi:hypothetical protein
MIGLKRRRLGIPIILCARSVLPMAYVPHADISHKLVCDDYVPASELEERSQVECTVSQ